MDIFAKHPAAERETYFREAAVRRGMPPHVIEKDFWVCWTLRRLFALESVADNLLFKGGTSLSKAHGLISRFSEDIDLSIHRASLGFEGEADPANPELSNKARKRQSEALSKATKEMVTGDIQTELSATIGALLSDESWELHPDPSDPDGQSLAFVYSSTGVTQETAAYIKPSVKIEFGARSDHWPAELKPVQPYLVDALPDALEDPTTEVKVMGADRTFWEKATILHQMAHLQPEKPLPARYSRHYCDLASMIAGGTGETAGQNDELLAAVVEHKMLFYRSAWASYDTAVRGSLKLLPAEDRTAELKRDLDSMKEMFFDQPPVFDDVLATLSAWQDAFNQADTPQP